MTQINAYLAFTGNCEEAMTFYKNCLGGDLSFQRLGESTIAGNIPPQMEQNVLHATLIKGSLMLMGSDMALGEELNQGNTVSLMLNCSTEEEIRTCYERLAAGGEATHPLEDTFWGALFGGLTDKFGHRWLLNFNKGNVS